jgi:hypothetical protein
MSVKITPVKDHEKYTVNGHLVYKNKWKFWACDHLLSDTELTAFTNYQILVIYNKAFKKHITATYKTK